MERTFLKGLGLETLSQTTGFGSGRLLSTASPRRLPARHTVSGSGIMDAFMAQPELLPARGLPIGGPWHQGPPALNREPDGPAAAAEAAQRGTPHICPHRDGQEKACWVAVLLTWQRGACGRSPGAHP